MRSTLRSILAAAGLLTGLAAATIAVPASPASAAACSDGGGVTVVVDPQQLGGGVQEVCDAGGAGKTAATIFEESGFHQSYTVNGGMVCRINGVPASDPCRNDPPATAYWSLWWSDGSTGWTYSSLGVGSLKIPAGGSVAWAWQGQSTKNLPSVAPAKTVATPTRATQAKATQAAPKPTKASPKSATHHVATPTLSASPRASASASADVSPSASPSPRASKRPKHIQASTTPTPVTPTSPDATASTDSAVTTADSTPTAASSDDDGLPGWIPPAIVAILAVAAGGIAVARRWTR